MKEVLGKIKSVLIVNQDMKFLTLKEFWLTIEKTSKTYDANIPNSIFIWNTQTDVESDILEINFEEIDSSKVKEEILDKIQFHTKKAIIQFE